MLAESREINLVLIDVLYVIYGPLMLIDVLDVIYGPFPHLQMSRWILLLTHVSPSMINKLELRNNVYFIISHFTSILPHSRDFQDYYCLAKRGML